MKEALRKERTELTNKVLVEIEKELEETSIQSLFKELGLSRKNYYYWRDGVTTISKDNYNAIMRKIKNIRLARGEIKLEDDNFLPLINAMWEEIRELRQEVELLKVN
ncbi:hypothetical protein ACQKMD_16630 [Viridibacillus sp. NPDC096237]|uniref:hypothetical protein n=1 Tax=Viridibacillus sp. NPDC096237 TaxID=3390721 RepID=UPI003D07A28E